MSTVSSQNIALQDHQDLESLIVMLSQLCCGILMQIVIGFAQAKNVLRAHTPITEKLSSWQIHRQITDCRCRVGQYSLLNTMMNCKNRQQSNLRSKNGYKQFLLLSVKRCETSRVMNYKGVHHLISCLVVILDASAFNQMVEKIQSKDSN